MLKRLVPQSIKIFLKWLRSCATWDQWANRSWSQEGEDRILSRIFGNQGVGFYIDVGAHHPKRFSNTQLFYKRGWRGINIDAMPGSMRAFNKTRPRDINMELGIGAEEGLLDYFVFNEPALNGFSSELSQKRHHTSSSYKIKEIIKVNVLPLSRVLQEHVPSGQIIDFMSVDVEGLDFEVLKSNDWEKFRPRYVLTEILGSSMHEIDRSEIGRLMNDAGYVLYAKCMNTVFFKEASHQ